MHGPPAKLRHHHGAHGADGLQEEGPQGQGQQRALLPADRIRKGLFLPGQQESLSHSTERVGEELRVCMTQRNGLNISSCCSQPLLEQLNIDAVKRQTVG